MHMVVSTSLVCLSSSEEQQQKNHIAKIITGSIFLVQTEQILSLDKGIQKPSLRNNS